jgi:hypothetical protein
MEWKSDETPVEQLKDAFPGLVTLIADSKSPELLEPVAEILNQLTRPTKRFVSFIETFVPAPPVGRPELYMQFSYAPGHLKKAMSLIYGHRYGFAPRHRVPAAYVRASPAFEARRGAAFGSGKAARLGDLFKQRHLESCTNADAPEYVRAHRARRALELVAIAGSEPTRRRQPLKRPRLSLARARDGRRTAETGFGLGSRQPGPAAPGAPRVESSVVKPI